MIMMIECRVMELKSILYIYYRIKVRFHPICKKDLKYKILYINIKKQISDDSAKLYYVILELTELLIYFF